MEMVVSNVAKRPIRVRTATHFQHLVVRRSLVTILAGWEQKPDFSGCEANKCQGSENNKRRQYLQLSEGENN